MSDKILLLFIFEFACLSGFALMDKNWGMFLYGLGGVILNWGVLIK